MLALGKILLSLVCWLALSHTAVWSTRALLYVLCCSVQGRLQAAVLCLLYVDAVVIGAWFVPSLRGVRRRSRLKKKQEKIGQDIG